MKGADGRPIVVLPPKTLQTMQVVLSPDEQAFYRSMENKSQKQFNVYVREGWRQNYHHILVRSPLPAQVVACIPVYSSRMLSALHRERLCKCLTDGVFTLGAWTEQVLLLRLRQACIHPYLAQVRGDPEAEAIELHAEDQVAGADRSSPAKLLLTWGRTHSQGLNFVVLARFPYVGHSHRCIKPIQHRSEPVWIAGTAAIRAPSRPGLLRCREGVGRRRQAAPVQQAGGAGRLRVPDLHGCCPGQGGHSLRPWPHVPGVHHPGPPAPGPSPCEAIACEQALQSMPRIASLEGFLADTLPIQSSASAG